jgi:hypothetical protein
MTCGLLTPKNSTIRVKISGDGYLATAKAGQVMWCFTMLDMEHVHSQLATWEFAVIDSAENHATLLALAEKFRPSLEDVFINGAKIYDQLYIVDIYLSADQKFLHVIFGLRGACSKYWCVWCVIDKSHKCSLLDMNKVNK